MHARRLEDPCETLHTHVHGAAPARATEARDAVFERLLAGFREGLLVALHSEPDGPARHLRAYVRSIQGNAQSRLARPGRGALLLGRPPYRMIWSEFAEELCAGDAFDPAQSVAVRHAAEALWYKHVRAPSSTSIHATATFDALGALLNAISSMAQWTREPR